MQSNLQHAPADVDCNPFTKRFGIRNVIANLDTMVIWCFRLPPGFVGDLRRMLSRRQVVPKRSSQCGWRISVHQPTVEALVYLAEQQKNHYGRPTGLTVNRLDFGLEYVTSTQAEAVVLKEYFKQHIRLLWSRQRYVDSYKEKTLYWASRKAAKNLVAYSDKQSRMIQEPVPCCRLELRLSRSTIVKRRLGLIELVRDTNPQHLFQRSVRMAWDEDGLEEYIKKEAKKQHRQAMRNGRAPDIRKIEARLRSLSRLGVVNFSGGRSHDYLLKVIPERLSFKELAWYS